MPTGSGGVVLASNLHSVLADLTFHAYRKASLSHISFKCSGHVRLRPRFWRDFLQGKCFLHRSSFSLSVNRLVDTQNFQTPKLCDDLTMLNVFLVAT